MFGLVVGVVNYELDIISYSSLPHNDFNKHKTGRVDEAMDTARFKSDR